MDTITFDFLGQYQFGRAFQDYLGLRKKFFVDGLHWGIPHNASVEMDQYDNPNTYYALAVAGDRVLGGARIMPTTAHWGDATYMLRDAKRGRMGGVPPELFTEEIVTPTVWECSRLVISEEVTSVADRTRVLGIICEGLVEIGLAHGASRLMTLSNLWLLRALKKLGYDAELMGAPYQSVEDGHKYAVMAMTAERLGEGPALPPGVVRPDVARPYAA